MQASVKHTLQNTASGRSSDSQFFLYPEEDFELSSSNLPSPISSETRSQKQDAQQPSQMTKIGLSQNPDMISSGLLSHFKKFQRQNTNLKSSRNMGNPKLRFKSEVNFKLHKDQSSPLYDDSLSAPKSQVQKSLLNLCEKYRNKEKKSQWSLELDQTEFEFEPVRADEENHSILSNDKQLELKALNVLDSISDLPILDQKDNFLHARYKQFKQQKRERNSARRLKKSQLLSPASSKGPQQFKNSGLSDIGKKSILKIPTIFPDSVSPWTQEISSLEPLQIFSEKSSKASTKLKPSFRKPINLQEFIQDYPLNMPKPKKEESGNIHCQNEQFEKESTPGLSDNLSDRGEHNPWKGLLRQQERITEEASPTLLDETSKMEKQKSLKKKGLERLFQKYQEIVAQSEKIKDNLRFAKPLKYVALKEKYVQRPKYWKFTKQSSPMSKRIKQKTEDHQRNSRSFVSCFSSRRQLTVNGSKVKMKKGNYSVNIDGYLSDKIFDNSYDDYQYSFHQRATSSYRSELRSPRSEEQSRVNTARSQPREKLLLNDRKTSQFTQSTQIDDGSDIASNRSVEFKSLLKAEDVRQRSYPFNSESRLSSSFTISSEDSLLEEIEGRGKKQCPTSLFKPFQGAREKQPSRNMGSSSFSFNKDVTRSGGQAKKSSKFSNSSKICLKTRVGGEYGGWTTPDGKISEIMKSKFKKVHTTMLATLNQNLRYRKKTKLM